MAKRQGEIPGMELPELPAALEDGDIELELIGGKERLKARTPSEDDDDNGAGE